MEPTDGVFRHRVFSSVLFACSNINLYFQYKSKHYYIMTSKKVNQNKNWGRNMYV